MRPSNHGLTVCWSVEATSSKMARLQRADMGGDDLAGEALPLRQHDQQRQGRGTGGAEAEPESGPAQPRPAPSRPAGGWRRRRRAGRLQPRHHPRPHRLGHRLGRLAAHQRARPQHFGPCRGADRAAGAVRFERGGLGSAEFAVDLGLDQEHLVASRPRIADGIAQPIAHGNPSAPAACASIRRARHRRDITVPIGVSVASAISL